MLARRIIKAIVPRLRQFFRLLILCCVVWVLGFSNYGLKDYIMFRREIAKLEKELTALEIEKEALLEQVNALSGPEIDLDKLEIQVRKILAYTRKNEKVYFWK